MRDAGGPHHSTAPPLHRSTTPPHHHSTTPPLHQPTNPPNHQFTKPLFSANQQQLRRTYSFAWGLRFLCLLGGLCYLKSPLFSFSPLTRPSHFAFAASRPRPQPDLILNLDPPRTPDGLGTLLVFGVSNQSSPVVTINLALLWGPFIGYAGLTGFKVAWVALYLLYFGEELHAVARGRAWLRAWLRVVVRVVARGCSYPLLRTSPLPPAPAPPHPATHLPIHPPALRVAMGLVLIVYCHNYWAVAPLLVHLWLLRLIYAFMRRTAGHSNEERHLLARQIAEFPRVVPPHPQAGGAGGAYEGLYGGLYGAAPMAALAAGQLEPDPLLLPGMV